MKVAVKVIHPQRVDDPQFRLRFAREVLAAMQVNSAYTAAVVDADPEAEQPWLATVHVAGVSLDQALKQHGPWPAHSVRALGAGLVEARAAIHTAGSCTAT
jgi:serine/threonine protein kinase